VGKRESPDRPDGLTDLPRAVVVEISVVSPDARPVRQLLAAVAVVLVIVAIAAAILAPGAGHQPVNALARERPPKALYGYPLACLSATILASDGDRAQRRFSCLAITRGVIGSRAPITPASRR
jgi:hypothetical protein